MKIQTKWIKTERATHKRDMGAPQIDSKTQAQRYASFLLSREGIEAAPNTIEVCFIHVRVNGRNVKRAWQYRFNATVYDFPHRDYVQPAPIEHVELPLAA
jgi:hypothetical protein